MKHFQNRFERHPGGAVPSRGRTSEEQLKYLDEKVFVAQKERSKLQKRITEKEGKK